MQFQTAAKDQPSDTLGAKLRGPRFNLDAAPLILDQRRLRR
jgi:hypothetical protein